MFINGHCPSSIANLEPRVRFWNFSHLWPEEFPGHLSLAAAVQAYGKKHFGEEWTGKEPADEIHSVLPRVMTATMLPTDLQSGCRLLYEGHPAYRRRCDDLGGLAMPTYTEWATAVQLAENTAVESEAACRRFFAACEALIQAFRSGRIHTGTRAQEGGVVQPLEPEDWNSERCHHRFDCGLLNPLELFVDRPVTQNGRWIYVERASFEAALEERTPVDVEGAAATLIASDRLSPYVKTEIVMSMALDLTADSPVAKKEVLKRMVPDYWVGPGRPTGRDCDRIATSLRHPEAKFGRADPRRRKAAS